MRSPVKPAVAVLCVHVVLPGAAVYGSGCPESSPCEQYWEADAVFVGTVTQLRCDEPPREPGGFRDEVELEVTEPFRGVTSRTLVVRTGACHDPDGLKAGRSYVVYAYRRGEDRTLRTSGCHLAELSSATEALAYARWVQTPRTRGRVYGTIEYRQWEPLRFEEVVHPVPDDLVVTLSGTGGSWRVRPHGSGKDTHFSFDEIVPGQYVLGIETKGAYTARGPLEFELRSPQLCHRQHLRIQSDGRIRGRILDARGRPVANVPVTITAVPRLARGLDGHQQTVSTDENGGFVQEYLAKGEYLLGVHSADRGPRDPKAPAIYFPGVSEREQAQPITVEPGTEVDVGDLRLPVAIEKVVVHGTVLTTDGRPLAECVVSMLSEVSTSFEHDLRALTDGNGRFQFTGIAGRPYQITVSKEEGDTLCLARARVTAGSGEPLTIRAECLTP